MHNNIKSVTFDLDGTLVDTAQDLYLTANEMLLELGLPLLSFSLIKKFIGKGADNFIARCILATAQSEQKVDELFDRGSKLYVDIYSRLNGSTAIVYPGVHEVLQALTRDGYKLAVVTNKPTQFCHPLLENLGLINYFDAVVSGGSTAALKPSPIPILFACRKIKSKASMNTHIGDSISDIDAARAAGSRAIGVSYGYSSDRPLSTINCDLLISSFDQIYSAITQYSFNGN